MSERGVLLIGVAAFLAAAGCNSRPGKDDSLPGADRLPADAVMYACIPNLGAFTASPVARELGFPAMDKAFDWIQKTGAYARRDETGTLHWILLLSPKDGMPPSGAVDGWNYATRDGYIAVTRDESELQRHLKCDVVPPAGIQSTYRHAENTKDPFLFLSLERWTPPALATWHLGLKGCRNLGFTVHDGSIQGLAEYLPNAYREIIARDVQCPRRLVRPLPGVAAFAMQSTALNQLLPRRKDTFRLDGLVSQTGSGWAIAAVQETDGSLDYVAFMETRTPAAATEWVSVLEKAYPAKSSVAERGGLIRFQAGSKGLEVRALDHFVAVSTSAHLLDSFAKLELAKLLPVESEEGDHVVISLTREALPLMAKKVPALMRQACGDEEVEPADVDLLLPKLGFDKADWRVRYTSQGAVVKAEFTASR